MPANLRVFSRRLQFPILLYMDLLLSPRWHVPRRDVADGAVLAYVALMLAAALHRTRRIVYCLPEGSGMIGLLAIQAVRLAGGGCCGHPHRRRSAASGAVLPAAAVR